MTVREGSPQDPDFDGEQFINAMVRAGWEKFCERLRVAGAKIIEDPHQAIRGLRFIADKLEEHAKRKGGAE